MQHLTTDTENDELVKELSFFKLMAHQWGSFPLLRVRYVGDDKLSESFAVASHHASALFVLRLMHSTVTGNIGNTQGYLVLRPLLVSNEAETQDFVNKLASASLSKKQNIGFDMRFLLKHHNTIQSGWEAAMSDLGTKWLSWDLNSELEETTRLSDDQLAKIKAKFKTEYQDKGKPFSVDDLNSVIDEYSKDRKGMTVLEGKVEKLLSDFYRNNFKKLLPVEEKEKLEKEAELLEEAINFLRVQSNEEDCY